MGSNPTPDNKYFFRVFVKSPKIESAFKKPKDFSRATCRGQYPLVAGLAEWLMRLLKAQLEQSAQVQILQSATEPFSQVPKEHEKRVFSF